MTSFILYRSIITNFNTISIDKRRVINRPAIPVIPGNHYKKQTTYLLLTVYTSYLHKPRSPPFQI
jgi:hypothetical protein